MVSPVAARPAPPHAPRGRPAAALRPVRPARGQPARRRGARHGRLRRRLARRGHAPGRPGCSPLRHGRRRRGSLAPLPRPHPRAPPHRPRRDGAALMPIVATATMEGRGLPLPLSGGGSGRGLFGTVAGGPSASFQGHVLRDLLESLSAPSIAYTFAVKLADAWVPRQHLLGPFEFAESIDTIAIRFSFGLVGRRWSIQLTETTWTSSPVEVWVTAGPIGAMRTWRRAFGFVLTCEQLEGIEPTLRVKCGDPSRLYDRTELCYELPADAGLTRGEICAEILTAQELTADIPAGALYRKPVITDS